MNLKKSNNTRTTGSIVNKILLYTTTTTTWPLNTHDSSSNSDQYEHLWLCCCGNISPLYLRCRDSGGHVGGSLKRNLISGIELRSAHSHQLQKLRSALVTGPTEAQLTYSLPVCTAVLHLSVVCLHLFFSIAPRLSAPAGFTMGCPTQSAHRPR